jgi:hypothetical protein
VATGGLVHHVARDEQAGAGVGELVEGLPELAAEDRIDVDGRLVEHEQLRFPEQRDRERGARELAAGERSRHLPGLAGQADEPDHLLDPRARGAEDAGEVAQILLDGQVGVDGWCLGDVGDAPAQRRRPGRLAEHRHAAALDDLNADDRAHERRLPRAARAEQPRHHAGRDPERDAGQDRLAAAADVEIADVDRSPARVL